MTIRQVHILRHSVGADSKSPGYRNYFAATDEDNIDCKELVNLGLMEFMGIRYGYFYYCVSVNGLKLLGVKSD